MPPKSQQFCSIHVHCANIELVWWANEGPQCTEICWVNIIRQRWPNKVYNIKTALGQHRHAIYNVGPMLAQPQVTICITLAQRYANMLGQPRPTVQLDVAPTSYANVGPTKSTTVCQRWPNTVMLSGFVCSPTNCNSIQCMEPHS
jgi:hypothetical protein